MDETEWGIFLLLFFIQDKKIRVNVQNMNKEQDNPVEEGAHFCMPDKKKQNLLDFSFIPLFPLLAGCHQ